MPAMPCFTTPLFAGLLLIPGLAVGGEPANPAATHTLRAAAVQMRSSRDLSVNIAAIGDHLRRCAADGARVVVFPECALTGYFDDDYFHQMKAADLAAAERQVCDACREANVYAILGAPVRDGDKLHNSALVINPRGRIIERYHKVQLAERWPDGGDHLSVFPIDGVPCSIIICHDERYPELVRLPVLAGSRVVFYISHESGVRQERKLGPYRAQIQARAVENGVFVVQSNAPANDDLSGSHGQSRIILPDGNIVEEAPMFEEAVVTATLDLNQAKAGNALNSVERGPLRDWWRQGIERVRMVEDPDAAIAAALARPLLGQDQTLHELLDHAEARLPRVPTAASAETWHAYASKLRQDILDKVVFRGAAAQWRDAPACVEWQTTIDGGPGYRIRKLRYEVLPGLWIPALLYEPTDLVGQVPAVLNVNGHDRKGKAADYKQIRCINQAKRGMLALNIEWLGMGQLTGEGYQHDRLAQIDLCGTSGVAPFYLCLKRALDVLLAHEHADPGRIAVTGLSGGGWQTIFCSALDPRVTLANPVAGYGSLRTGMRANDLGDAEQSPCDFGLLADYDHLTALMAPRPLLLTYNIKDDCCFQSANALPPLAAAGGPIYQLLGHADRLRSHVNHDPGTHNFERDNREALYRMLGDHFFAGDATFDAREIAYAGEVKSADELAVELPPANHDLHTLATELMRDLPRDAALPTDAATVPAWQADRRERLRACVRFPTWDVSWREDDRREVGGMTITHGRARIGPWTVPVVEISREEPKETAILLADDGRSAMSAEAARLVDDGYRVLAIDSLFCGESRITSRDPQQYVVALLLSCIGDRPLGIQAGQTAAIARWARTRFDCRVRLVAHGPRCGTAALAAAALETEGVAAVELHNPLGSLKELIERNGSAQQDSELFCFGLLELADIPQIVGAIAPRTVRVHGPSERVQTEFAGLVEFCSISDTNLDLRTPATDGRTPTP
jgi:predicted amidohydrolase/dienelactone hydrolase